MFKRLFGKKEKLDVPPFVLPDESDCRTTESGLRYEVVRAGTGALPCSADKVTVHYAGWTTEGKLFDASYSRGETTTFPLTAVIKGWTEGLQLMNEGAIFRFVIPPNLAYVNRGAPPAIGPGETLVFQVELVTIK